jgi:hypothetical protein
LGDAGDHHRIAVGQRMKAKMLSDVLERVEAWPPGAQDQLAEIALEIEASLSGEQYEPTPPRSLPASTAASSRLVRAVSPATSR